MCIFSPHVANLGVSSSPSRSDKALHKRSFTSNPVEANRIDIRCHSVTNAKPNALLLATWNDSTIEPASE